MNFRILFTISFIFLACLMAAQSPTTQRGSYLGITGGLGTVWIVGQHNYGVPNFSGVARTAYLGGVVGGVTLKRGHGIHGEVAFSLQKYEYRDVRNIAGQEREVVAGKQLDFVYLRIPLTYRRVIGIKDGDTDIGDSKFFWGAGLDIGALYDVQLEYSINGKPNDNFVFITSYNPNIEFPPPKDRYLVLFNAMDIALTGSFGWEHFLTEHVVFQAELKGTASMMDINDAEWRIKNEADKYTSSRHMMLHLKCSLIYYVNRVKRLDVY